MHAMYSANIPRCVGYSPERLAQVQDLSRGRVLGTRALATLRDQSLDKNRDQLVGNRLRQRELDGALTGQIGSNLRL
jgi:isochorismate synthase EntC